jgi:dienelactone hydrolase
MTRSVVIAVCLWMSTSGLLRAQTLEVIPPQAMVDESAVVRADGLTPGERVSIRAELVDGAGHAWASAADFIADSQGIVDLSKQAPVKGSYSDLSPMGLVWSMKPSDDARSYASPPNLGAQTIQFQLLRQGQQLSIAQLQQRQVADTVRQIKINGQIHGTLFLPNVSGPAPAVLVVGGSEGGEPLQKAAWLASHGYVAFALAYFRCADLPRDLEAIPLEYFGIALNWMMKRPEVLPDRVAVVGTSRGGELALQLGSMYPQIAAVVAYVPANVRYPACCGNNHLPYAWTRKGQPLAYIPVQFLRNPDPVTKMQASIAVEQTNGPVLLISGQDDGVWEWSPMAEAVVQRLRMSHFAHRVEHLDYPHAGHLAGRAEIVPAWHGTLPQPVSGRMTIFGGTPKGNAESSIDAIGKVLQFLAQSLQTQTAPGHQSTQ